MKYLHTMVRVTDLDQSMAFYCDALGLKEVERYEYPEGRFTLVMLATGPRLTYMMFDKLSHRLDGNLSKYSSIVVVTNIRRV